MDIDTLGWVLTSLVVLASLVGTVIAVREIWRFSRKDKNNGQ